MSLEQLMAMKREMLGMGNFREVERINKIIKFRETQPGESLDDPIVK